MLREKKGKKKEKVYVWVCFFNIENNIFSRSFFSGVIFVVNIGLHKIFVKYWKPHEIFHDIIFTRKKELKR